MRVVSKFHLLLAAALSVCLTGCVSVSVDRSNDLPKAPASLAALPLPPVPVAFIVKPSLPKFTDSIAENENRREVEAWKLALQDYADSSRIYIQSGGDLAGMPADLRGFCRTHPVVTVRIFEDTERDLRLETFENFGVMVVDLASLGLVPLNYRSRYKAQFSLALPGDAIAAQPGVGVSLQQDYSFARLFSLSPLYLLPSGDQVYGIYDVGLDADSYQTDLTDWRIEEKRGLLARFMREAQPLLEQYARRAATARENKP